MAGLVPRAWSRYRTWWIAHAVALFFSGGIVHAFDAGSSDPGNLRVFDDLVSGNPNGCRTEAGFLQASRNITQLLFLTDRLGAYNQYHYNSGYYQSATNAWSANESDYPRSTVGVLAELSSANIASIRSACGWTAATLTDNTPSSGFGDAVTSFAAATSASMTLDYTYDSRTFRVTWSVTGGANDIASVSSVYTGTPNAPTALSASPGDGSATISFTAPSDLPTGTGETGNAVTNYEYSTDGGSTWTALSPADTTSPVTIGGLSNSVSYTISLRAINGVGIGKASSSVSVTPADSTPPSVTFDPPDAASGVAADKSITITFNEPVRNINDSALTDANVDSLITLKDTNAGGANIAFDATMNAAKTVITIDPSSDFSSGQTVYAAIGPTVEDAGDNAITASSSTFVAVTDTSSPSVQILNAPATLSGMNPFNVTIKFNENVTGFALGDIAVGNGVASNFVADDGSTYRADISPGGTGDVTIDVAANVAQDAASNPNTAASQVTVTCGPGCGHAATVEATRNAIANFTGRRASLLTAQGPGISGFLSGDGLGGGFNGMLGGPVAINYHGDSGNHAGSFSTSLQQFGNFKRSFNNTGDNVSVAADVSATNVWIKGRWTRAQDDRSGTNHDLDFGIVYVGADYRYSDDLLVGVMGQIDWYDETSDVLDSEGDGWMIGPYVVTRLSDSLVVDLRLAWGQSDNSINPFGTYWDNFETERWQIEGNVTGSIDSGRWHIAPALGLNYFKETQKSYTDSNGFRIGGQTIELGTLTFGPTFSYQMSTEDGYEFTPMIGLAGIWDFAAPDIYDVNGIASGTEALRAQLKLGLKFAHLNGAVFQIHYVYDGIGLDDYHSHTGELAINFPLRHRALPKGSSLQGSYALHSSHVLHTDDDHTGKLELKIPFD